MVLPNQKKCEKQGITFANLSIFGALINLFNYHKMKKRIFSIFSIALLGLAIMSSCSKDDSPDYVGKWSSEYTDQAITYKETITLGESSFNVSSLMNFGLVFTEVGGAKGTFTANGNKLTANITSEASYDFVNVMLVWVNVDKTMIFEYAVSGDTLTLKYDENENGIFEAEEVTTYTKE